MLRHFDDELDLQRSRVTKTPEAVTDQPAPPRPEPVTSPARTEVVEHRMVQTVTTTAMPSASRSFLSKDDEQWEWGELRDYVVHQIEQHHGVFPRDFRKESSIFKSFIERYPQAPAIARFAFVECQGFWSGAPISVNRFCKGSDPYFADVIASRLSQPKTDDW